MWLRLWFLAAMVGLFALQWTRRTRATRWERRRPLPGDDLVPAPLWQATRGVTIGAPAARVWPWLVQMGYPTHRAGWYTPYLMDRVVFGIRARSSERLVPQLQDLSVGDRVLDSDDGTAYFTVATIDPPQALVLLSHTHPLPVYRDVAFSWAFVVEDRDRSRSRLLMRARVTCTPVAAAPLVRALIRVAFGAGDVVQAGAMLSGIRRRVEGRGHPGRISRRCSRRGPGPAS